MDSVNQTTTQVFSDEVLKEFEFKTEYLKSGTIKLKSFLKNEKGDLFEQCYSLVNINGNEPDFTLKTIKANDQSSDQILHIFHEDKVIHDNCDRIIAEKIVVPRIKTLFGKDLNLNKIVYIGEGSSQIYDEIFRHFELQIGLIKNRNYFMEISMFIWERCYVEGREFIVLAGDDKDYNANMGLRIEVTHEEFIAHIETAKRLNKHDR